MDQNAKIWLKGKPDPDKFEKKPVSGMAIAGYNLLVMVSYSLLIKFVEGLSGMFLDAIILSLHVFFCFGMAGDRKSWVWLLSALLVLIIGFSTCVYVNPFNLN